MINTKEVIGKLDSNALKQDYMNAVSDKSFKSYLDLLNIEEDILMKYTSVLQDAYEEFLNCKDCKSLKNCKDIVEGYLTKPTKQGKMISFPCVPCPKKSKQLKEDAYKNNLTFYNVPEELQKASFKEIYQDDETRLPIIKYFKEFMDDYKHGKQPKGLYLNGSFGSGKTYLVASLFNEMAKKNTKSSLVYYPELLRDLKASLLVVITRSLML
jgi:primosomal protein DnaI